MICIVITVIIIAADACKESEYFLLPFCYTECPKHFYASNETFPAREQHKQPQHWRPVCLRCHPTCLLCSGPHPNQCLNCSIHRALTVDHRCVDVDLDGRRLSPLLIIALVTLPVGIFGIGGACVWMWMQRRRPKNRLVTLPH